jgi:glycyl-tRNA synthetase
VYLRPETAQGIFVNFHNVQQTARLAVPFGIAQIGKAFRNEIVARQFVFRMREFEQMEMQYFVKPGTRRSPSRPGAQKRLQWHLDNGVRQSNLRWHVHEKLAHYADAAQDIQYQFPMGWQEVEGIHSRTDFDLASHQEYSGKKMEYFDPQTQERYIPYVVETSVGLDRTILMILCDAYREEEVASGEKTETRSVLKFHPAVAPYTVAVFPLVKKEGMPEKAHAIEDDLRRSSTCSTTRRGLGRQALPPAGRDRHAVLRDRGRRHPRRRHRHRSATATRCSRTASPPRTSAATSRTASTAGRRRTEAPLAALGFSRSFGGRRACGEMRGG